MNTQKNILWQCAVVKGDYKSLSPLIHTAGYDALGLKDFVYKELTVAPEELETLIKTVRNKKNHYRGLSIGNPHKIAIMSLVDEVDEAATEIGAVNTVVVSNGKLIGTNTDWQGALNALERHQVKIEGMNIAVVGAGGAAKATIFGLLKKNPKRIKVFNRTLAEAKARAKQFHVEAGSLSELDTELAGFNIVINATSIGMHGEEPIIPASHLRPDVTVVEWDYSGDLAKTKLEEAAEKIGAKVIPGRDILLGQALDQFKKFTGYDAPDTAMREVIYGKTN